MSYLRLFDFSFISSLYILNLSSLSSYSLCKCLIYSVVFAFLLINGDKLFFFWWTIVANFTGVKFINLFLYVRTWYGLVKIFPYLRTWRCVPTFSSKAEEIIQGLGSYLPPAKHLTVPAVWDQAEIFSDDLLAQQSCSSAILESHPGGGGISPRYQHWKALDSNSLSLQLWVYQKYTSTSQMCLPNWQITHFSQKRSITSLKHIY